MTGCGGYVYDNGEVFSPDFFDDLVGDCVWFVEARQNGDAIFLKRNYTISTNQPKITVRIPKTFLLCKKKKILLFTILHWAGKKNVNRKIRYVTVGVLPDKCCTMSKILLKEGWWYTP